MMRWAIVITTFWWSITTITATEPHFNVRELDEAYAHLNINQIFQDRNCMIWLGTSSGLFQYTGSDLIPMPFPDSMNGLSVSTLYEDHNGTLWVGTETGVIFQYDAEQRLHPWTPEEGLPKVRITGFLEDNHNQLWISTYGEGMYVFSHERLYNLNTDDQLADNDVYMIARDGKGRIWAGTDNGVSICSFNESTKSVQSLSVAQGLPDQIVRALISDRLGNMWITTYEAGVAYYDVQREAIAHIISDPRVGHIGCVALFEDLELWIGTEGNGVWRYMPAVNSFRKISGVPDLQNAEIRDLLKDVEGNLWVVSSPNILHTAYRPFETLSLPIGNIQSIHVSSPDHVWLGTDDGLYTAWDDTSGTWRYRKIPNTPFTSVACLGRDLYGNIWIGSLDHGLCVFHPDTKHFITFQQEEALRNNPIISLFIEDKTIWMATLGRGIIKATITGNVMEGMKPSLLVLGDDQSKSHNFIYQVMPKEGNEVWLATDGAGLAYTSGQHTEALGFENEYAPRKIYATALDATGHIWMITPNNGLVEFDGTNYHPLTIEDGLRSLSISSLIGGPKGELLIVHSKGIDVMIPERRHFMYFDDEIGIANATPVLNSVCRDADGNVWIGMQNKIVKYSGLQEDISIHPRTRIEQVSVNQQPIDFITCNKFPAQQNFFEFDYIGLWYTSPSIVKYQYTLVGHDLSWKETGDHLAIYSNLKPGKYVFRVKASENKSFYDEPLAEYSFEIRKPFWQEAWFIILVTILIVYVIYLFMKSREKRLRRIELLNKEKVESQLRALKAQINPHFLFNSFNTLITIIDENTGNPDVPIEYVQKLADFYRSILQYREEEAISVPEEIDLVKNYYYLLQRRYGDNLMLDININGMQGFIPPLTLQMLVENAVKHNVISKSKPLTISIHGDGEDYVVVENNLQRKLSDAPSTRFGLQSIINRYELISVKKVKVEETSDSFKVSIPIIKKN